MNATAEIFSIRDFASEVAANVRANVAEVARESFGVNLVSNTLVDVTNDVANMRDVRNELATMKSFMEDSVVYDPREAAAILNALNGPVSDVRGSVVRRRN